MLVTLISWSIMLFIFTTVGMGINKIIDKVYSNNKSSLSDIIWYGIGCVTVYAQLFSLFYKVGQLAVAIIFLVAGVLVYFCRKEYLKLKNRIFDFFQQDRKRSLWLTAGAVILMVGLVFTVQVAGHYDTNLYHAQNIRWIEEYGIVKGLGNLHNRFAYNSAFMCLQALFSFSWCTQSLHTLNGFLWVFMVSYSIGTLKIYKEKKIYASDLFKMLMLFYLCNDIVIYNLSSPHTDMMTLTMVLYIAIRWNELVEENYQGYTMYGILCLLAVCAVSVKLSAVMVLILVLKPAIALLREKKWSVISWFIGIGILIIVPFLIRNVVLSGYLVYPYASIDLFDVDWKMEKALVVYDNQEIVVWGRMLKDPSRYHEPITTWLPIWLKSCEKIYSVMMIFNLILLPVSIAVFIFYIRKKQYDQSLILACVEVLYLGWLFTAPLPRYGLVYLFVTPIFYLSIVLKWVFSKKNRNVFIRVLFICVMLIIVFKPCDRTMKNIDDTLEKYLIMPADYNNSFEMCSVEWEGIEVYLPVEGDRGNYTEFPAIPYLDRLMKAEFRGETLGDGFRLRSKE